MLRIPVELRFPPVSNPAFTPSRVLPLDGLRGFLALGVFFHHAAIYQHYLRDGSWWTDSSFFGLLGPFGVTLFFMITAFLFYGRLIAEDGRPDWRRLYLGRLFRIGPVYLLAILALFAVVAAETEFTLRAGMGELLSQILCWLALGAGPGVDLNGLADTRHLMAGVTWTLQSEWLFYASLPLLALAARGPKTNLLVAAGGLVTTLAWLALGAPASFPACVAPFFAGMTCAALQQRAHVPKLPDWLASLLIVGLIAAFFTAGLGPRLPAAVLLLGGAFYLIASGGTVFGLLTSGPARWLGSISYGIYMLHGLVLSRLCATGAVRAFALASPAGHCLMVALAAGLVILLAYAAHVLVELPGIALGKRLARGRIGHGQSPNLGFATVSSLPRPAGRVKGGERSVP